MRYLLHTAPLVLPVKTARYIPSLDCDTQYEFDTAFKTKFWRLRKHGLLSRLGIGRPDIVASLTQRPYPERYCETRLLPAIDSNVEKLSCRVRGLSKPAFCQQRKKHNHRGTYQGQCHVQVPSTNIISNGTNPTTNATTEKHYRNEHGHQAGAYGGVTH